VSIKYVRTDEFFDLHVPLANCYEAHGLIHHNTGKTMGIGWVIREILETNPGVRIGLLRKVRADLPDSCLRTWEEFVLGPDHYTVRNGPSRKGRSSYRFKNGSELVVGGLDRDTRLFSAEYDGFWINECIELSESNWEYLSRALRNNAYRVDGQVVQFKIGDTNPREPSHWANRRPNRDGCVRVITRHHDNAGYYNLDTGEWTEDGVRYIRNLRMMSGVRRQRLLEGKWCAAEGAIWPNFDASIHVIPRSKVPKKPRYYLGSQDFGFAAPGTLGIWAVERAEHGDRMYLIHEVYHANQGQDWWSDWIVGWDRQYHLTSVECDSAEPDRILAQNRALGRLGGRDGRAVCVKAQKDRSAGLSLVNDMLNPQQIGGPRIFFVEDALASVDQDLLATRAPTRTVDEIDSYVYREMSREEDIARDEPDPRCVDHGCFPAGTLVLTPEGERPIEEIEDGDLVVTPNGPERVSASALTGVDRELVEIVHEQGSLVCTPDHPVFVDGLGMVSAGAIKSGMLLSCATTVLSTTAGCGIGIQTPKTGAAATTRPRLSGSVSVSIATSGSSTTGRFRRGCRSITGTAIAAETTSATLNSSAPPSMGGGTGSTGTGSWPSGSGEPSPKTASTGGPVGSVVSPLTLPPTSGGGTAGVRARLRPTAAITPATTRVISVRPAGRADVFNLTVEPTHVYYAEGVLVSNCDMVRYAAMRVYLQGGAKVERAGVARRYRRANSLGVDHEIMGMVE
jgi:hypothetical protein